MNEVEDYNFLVGALKKDFGMVVSDPKRVEEGFSNKVYSAKVNTEEIFIRINEDKGVFPVEAFIYEELAERGIPVPNIKACSEEPELTGHPTMIVSKVPGIAISKAGLSLEEEQNIYRKAGDILRRIHNVKIPGSGTLKLENGELRGKSSSWGEVWDEHFSIPKEIEYLLKNELISQEQASSIGKILEEVKGVELESSSLLHADFQGTHIFTDGTEITGVIDFGSVLAGDPRYDIAISLVFLDSELHGSFKEGYGDQANDPLIDKYLKMVATYKAGWRHRKGLKEGTDKALKILKEKLNT